MNRFLSFLAALLCVSFLAALPAFASEIVPLSTTTYADLGMGPFSFAVTGRAAYVIAGSLPAANVTGTPIDDKSPAVIAQNGQHVYAIAIDPGILARTFASAAARRTNPVIILAQNLTASGTTTPYVGVDGGKYFVECTSNNWGGASAQLQVLGSDGVTWSNLGSPTGALNGGGYVSVSAGATVALNISGGTPISLSCDMSGPL